MQCGGCHQQDDAKGNDCIGEVQHWHLPQRVDPLVFKDRPHQKRICSVCRGSVFQTKTALLSLHTHRSAFQGQDNICVTLATSRMASIGASTPPKDMLFERYLNVKSSVKLSLKVSKIVQELLNYRNQGVSLDSVSTKATLQPMLWWFLDAPTAHGVQTSEAWEGECASFHPHVASCNYYFDLPSRNLDKITHSKSLLKPLERLNRFA